MKKILSVFLTVVIFSMMLLVNVSADEDLSRHQPTPYGIAKFEEYISQIDPEQARLILSDSELVYNMQMDYYWDENPVVTPSRRASLPLSEYPSGSYYSFNSKGCSCHSNSCTWDVPANVTKKDRCYGTKTKTSGDCKIYKGTNAIQCKGFADYVCKQYNGHDVGSSYAISGAPSSITNDTTGQNAWKSFANKLYVGSNVRVKVRGKTYYHSFIVTKKSSTGLTIYDANRVSNNCKVSVATLTWADLAKKYNGVVNAWK